MKNPQQTAVDVMVQWRGVDIDYTDVRAELDAHWGDLEGGCDTEEFRDQVAAAIMRARACG